ncbi:MAG: energy transducer TonB [Calditrichaeota bacterium]|nr:MAG: energy transducer TonB [Calditrichota bacterium]MBL1204888.1 energy transducer TonB [Calditrichota bacterium]NOG44717.1 energy transducer TonB [Calditrichota bacterium]
MSIHKDQDADLRYKYKRRLELSFILSLSLVTLLFYSFKENNSGPPPIPDIPDFTIEVVKIPPTIQHKRPPRPPQPTIPIASDDEDLPEDVQLEKLFDPEIDFDIEPPEPEEDEEPFTLWMVSEKPVLLYKEVPYYPELAQKVGIEGRVTVMVVISKTGTVLSATLMGEKNMLSDAAIAAALKCTFKPAKQFDKFVKVKMTIPFDFRLR